MATKKHQIKEILKDEKFKKYIQTILENSNNETVNNFSSKLSKELKLLATDDIDYKYKKEMRETSNIMGPIISLFGVPISLLSLTNALNEDNPVFKGIFILLTICGILVISSSGLFIKNMIKDSKSNKELLEVLEKLQEQYKQNNNPSMGS